MIGRSEEYEKMYQLEGKLWWYRSLHERVAEALQAHFGDRRDMSILDVGCGTGGLMAFLRDRGYTNLRGIDGSTDAVAACRERGLTVSLVDLNELAETGEKYDAVVCNDVFCYFLGDRLPALMRKLATRLLPAGILISNNNAFEVFKGQHDLAVGIARRFTRADFERLLPGTGLRIERSTYWSFLLSPVILLMRQWQNLELRLGWQSPESPKSDVYLPSPWLNETLYRVVHTEQKLLPRLPFGSSLFIVFCPV
ncbi:class I SAM-dependent DNA methyltransferase [Spirosoma sp. KUDC1026]|uniref:class I SAM-dependent DNA methyltransferase n=1 Tax=Spirosoma sp. KUDC1026 TaxID=2745947 RepID=UPI00159B8D68|nr:class I SAM-dependent methyltransferase [Spirosoma sp. KUDC1026]QKZ14598.1 class I SAM-dependent methyltransferase [Spirosoma sp. KUDC1026]